MTVESGCMDQDSAKDKVMLALYKFFTSCKCTYLSMPIMIIRY